MDREGGSREPILIPGASARSFTVAHGEVFRVIDVEGQQVADFAAFNAADLAETSSPGQTILFNYPRVRLRPGQRFFSSRGRPMFEIVADDAGGVHDFLYAPCNRFWYESMGLSGHRSCGDNFLEALADRGIGWDRLPSPINLFQDTYPQADGTVAARPSPTGPGDGIMLRALLDCIVAVTSCSFDLEGPETSINGVGPSPIRIEFG